MGISHARALVNEGARIVSFDINSGEGPILEKELGEGKFSFLRGDVTSAKDWDNVVAHCCKHFGRPNVLVNNAGISPIQRLETSSEADYRKVIDINQVGTFLGMRALIPWMREAGGGSIINIASTAAHVGFADIFAYTASKWAVRGMTKAAALELARAGIRVNTVCPGDTDTPLLRDVVNASAEAAPPATELPMQRWARPEEISAAVVFLASNDSSYINGTDIVVDGAFTAQ